MGVPVLILGESGSGKTYSIKNLDPETTGLFLVEKGILPFRKRFPNTVKNANYGKIIASLKLHNLPRYVIDDSQYLMANEFFDRANETGYQKFTDMALNFRNLIHFVINKAPDDVIVYFLHHTEPDSDGRENDGGAACHGDAHLDCLGDLIQIHMTGNDFVMGADDADERTAHFFLCQTESEEKTSVGRAVHALFDLIGKHKNLQIWNKLKKL